MITDTRLTVIDRRRGIASGYATIFSRRCLHGYYYTPRTRLTMNPRTPLTFIPALVDHEFSDDMCAGKVIRFMRDGVGLLTLIQLRSAANCSEYVWDLLREKTAYLSAGHGRMDLADDDRVCYVNIEEVTITPFPAIRPDDFATDRAYLRAIKAAGGQLSSSVDLRKLARPIRSEYAAQP